MQLNQMVLDLSLKCFVTTKLEAGDGQWSKRGWMVLWILTATGLTTRMALVTSMASLARTGKNTPLDKIPEQASSRSGRF